jgi:hypothetical protein
MEIKGNCRDCVFLKQDWTVFEKKGQLVQEIDWVCFICDIFKRQDGYCDMWEPK